jgi:hypothetical protein
MLGCSLASAPVVVGHRRVKVLEAIGLALQPIEPAEPLEPSPRDP